ncbi:O-antigen ligase family protein [Paenibacillus alvei]|uniref:O-antigen ligase family protein n=2 Tax=Paenibacillus alvei TaxID=44250 RepID=A0ABT4GT00_PAEAL|nr:O-antigen ligase family protein [Paenibacillus alvei]EJW18360.1 WsfB [Paenibacillus alvei DSM 29]MCY9540327.1 O-antigen ligase family protein [Paenibacillus alvei]MCY9703060.1 O-antigen ligase family protein [Paenibacillus alvei]MCY9735717.1 O-antigen ligase family protein [Paenibacillus alvei]MCY9752801.1 O-antigen ligase family protein [Paenibacillus alvei]
MSTYGYTGSKAKKNAEGSKAPWLLLGVIILFLLWSTFKVALFNGQMADFDQPIYVAALFSSIIAMIAIAVGWKQFNWSSRKDILSLFVFLLPASFALSMITAASNYLAVNMLIIMLMYCIFFVASSIIAQDSVVNRTLNLAIMIISYIVVFFGLFHWLGNGPGVTTLIKWLGISTTPSGAYLNAVMSDSNGERLASVFQYANTYAGFLMAFLLGALFFISKSQKWWGKSGHAFMIVPIMLSIFLTLSRGGLLLLPVAFIVVLVFLKPYRQLMWIMHLAVSGVITVLILNPVTDIGLQVQKEFAASNSFKGWAYIIISSLIAAAISYALERWVSPWLEQKTTAISNKRWGTFLIPVGGAVLGALLLFVLIGTNIKNMLPENISTRLETINLQQHSVLERITFYKDSMKLIADYPFIGAGGGAWAALYAKYENNPYDVQQAHSFYMQYLVETGVIGMLILIAFLIYIYWNYIRTFINTTDEKRDDHFLFFILATSILIHSAMDFNMSFVYIGILVFLCLGGMTASIDSKPLDKVKSKAMRTVFASIFGIVSIGLFITSILFVQASSSFASAKETVLTTQDFTKTMVQLRKAKSIRSTHPEYAAFEANLYMSVYQQQKDEQFYAEAEKVLKNALGDNPHNKSLLLQLIKLYNIKGLDEQVYTVYSQNASNFPWDMKWYAEYMDKASLEGYKAISTAPDKKDGYLNEVIAAFEHVKASVEHLKTLPKGQLQGNPFYVTSSMAMNAGRAYLMKGDPAKAAEAMKPYLQEDLTNSNDPENSPENNRELARWYVAATIQQGQVDQNWYDKLVALGSDQKEQIDQIAGMRFKAE